MLQLIQDQLMLNLEMTRFYIGKQYIVLAYTNYNIEHPRRVISQRKLSKSQKR